MLLTMCHLGSIWAIRLGGIHYMTRATVLLFMLLLAASSDQTPPTQAVNEMIESPLQNTVISSADHYRPEPVLITGSINAKVLELIGCYLRQLVRRQSANHRLVNVVRSSYLDQSFA